MSAKQINEARACANQNMSRAGAATRGCVLAAVVLLGGCGVNRVLPPPSAPYDYRDRHPVVLAEAIYTLDLFSSPEGARLDSVNAARIAEFVANYRSLGRGKITILAPAGASSPPRQAIAEIRRALAEAGVGAGSIMLASYPVTDGRLAAPSA